MTEMWKLIEETGHSCITLHMFHASDSSCSSVDYFSAQLKPISFCFRPDVKTDQLLTLTASPPTCSLYISCVQHIGWDFPTVHHPLQSILCSGYVSIRCCRRLRSRTEGLRTRSSYILEIHTRMPMALYQQQFCKGNKIVWTYLNTALQVASRLCLELSFVRLIGSIFFSPGRVFFVIGQTGNLCTVSSTQSDSPTCARLACSWKSHHRLEATAGFCVLSASLNVS